MERLISENSEKNSLHNNTHARMRYGIQNTHKTHTRDIYLIYKIIHAHA